MVQVSKLLIGCSALVALAQGRKGHTVPGPASSDGTLPPPAKPSTGLRGSTPNEGDIQKMINIGDMLAGIDILSFAPLEPTDGLRSAIFAPTYYEGQKTGDELFMVPDGLDMTRAQVCSVEAKTSQVAGETSLMKSSTLEVKVDLSGGYGPVKGSLQNSNTFKHMSEETNKNENFFFTTEMSCKLYQVKHQTYSPPHFAKNFLAGLNTLKGVTSSDNFSTFSKFLASFGTHFQAGASMGSKYFQTRMSSKEEFTALKSGAVDIKVAASASALGNSVGASVLSDHQKSSSDYFESKSSNYRAASIGASMPTGTTQDALTADWVSKTETSTGLAAVGDYFFGRIDSLLEPTALENLNEDMVTYKLPKMTQDELSQIKENLGQAIEAYCTTKPGFSCGDVKPDQQLPEPVSGLDVQPMGPLSGEASGGTQFLPKKYDIAGLFGQKSLTMDILPSEVRVWWDDESRISGLEVEYTNALGVKRTGERYGRAISDKNSCKMTIQGGEYIRQVGIRADEWIYNIEISTDKETQSCGPSTQGAKKLYTAQAREGMPGGQNYFIGFWGKAHPNTIASLAPVATYPPQKFGR